MAAPADSFSSKLSKLTKDLAKLFSLLDSCPEEAARLSGSVLSQTKSFLSGLVPDGRQQVSESLDADTVRSVFFVPGAVADDDMPVAKQNLTADALLKNTALFSSPAAKASGKTSPAAEEVQGTNDRRANFNSFSARFVVLQYVTMLYVSLCKCAHLWRTVANYYAPYLAIVNASMMGKSRMVSELWRKGIFTFTICLRADDSALLTPPRTPSIADWLTELLKHTDKDEQLNKLEFLEPATNQICLFFLHSLDELKTWLESQCRQQRSFLRKLDRVDLAKRWSRRFADAEHLKTVWASVHAAVQIDPTRRPAMPKEASESLDVIMAKAKLEHPDPELHAKHVREAARALASSWASEISAKQAEIRALLDTHTTPLPTVTEDPKDPKNTTFSALDVLFVVDEARNLGTAGFFAFRRALKCFPSSSSTSSLSMFCTVLDTSSKISNFSPVKGSDPSLRETQSGDLFPPFSHVMSFDLWWHAAARLDLPVPRPETQQILFCARAIIAASGDLASLQSSSSSEDVAVSRRPLDEAVTLDVLKSFEFNMLFGRPLFYPFYLNLLALGSNATSLLLMLAMCKLLDMRTISLGQTRIVQSLAFPDWADKALSAAGVLLALDISPRSETASSLASAFMRPIAAISSDREQVFTLMTAEPLLALAARQLLASQVVSWDLILQALLVEEFKANHVMVGFRGEVAAQILFTAAWQAAVARLPDGDYAEANSFPCVSAFDFLDSLLGTQLVNHGVALGVLAATGPEGDTRTGFERFVEDADFSPLFEAPTNLSDPGLWRKDVEKRLDALVSLWWEGEDDGTVLQQAKPLFGRCRKQVSANEIMEVLELFCTYRTLVPLAEKLRGGYVRLNQFVKTFSQPSLGMLRDFFLRGAGIYCMERQPIADLAVTIHFPSKAAGDTCSEVTLSVVIGQVKLHRSFLSRNVKEAWLSTVPSLGLSGGGSQTPFVAIFIEFGHFEKYVKEPGSLRIRPVYSTACKPSDESPKRKARKTAPSIKTRQEPDIIGFGIFTKRPRLSEILPADRFTPETDGLLQKLLVSAVDPASSQSVATSERAAVSQMFRDLVYYPPN